MQIAARMDLSRSHLTGTEGRIAALVLATGIAGLSITPPTVTVEKTAGEWTGRFEVKPLHLTMPTMAPNTPIAANLQGSARVMTDAIKAGAVELSKMSNVLAPEIKLTTEARAATSVPPRAVGERFFPALQLAPSKPAVQSESVGPGIKAKSPQHSIGHVDAEPMAPLDAVRIALPPASSEPVAAMPPKATLDRIAATGNEPPAPVSTPDTQPLAVSASPETLTVSAPGKLSDPQSLNLFSAPKDVQEFDLAKLGSTKSATQALVQPSSNALAAAASKAAPRPRSLAKIAKEPDRIVGNYIIHVAGLSLEGVPSGNLPVRIGMTGELSVRLADMLTPMQDLIAPDTFERLASSSAASEYVSFADLRAAGFDVRYDAGNDRLMVSAQL